MGHKTRTIETYNNGTIWHDCDVIVHRPGWRVVSWLANPESVNRNPRIPFDPHQIRFCLPPNNYSSSSMAGNASSHPSFVCREPFNREQVTCFDAHYFAGFATNLADPYPTAYLVRSESWRHCWHFWPKSFRFPNVVGMGLSFQKRRTTTLFNIFNVGRMTTSLTLGARAPGTSGNILGTLKALDQFASDVSTRHSLIAFGM